LTYPLKGRDHTEPISPEGLLHHTCRCSVTLYPKTIRSVWINLMTIRNGLMNKELQLHYIQVMSRNFWSS